MAIDRVSTTINAKNLDRPGTLVSTLYHHLGKVLNPEWRTEWNEHAPKKQHISSIISASLVTSTARGRKAKNIRQKLSGRQT